MTFESNLVELRLILMQMTNKSYEMHHVDWPIIHSKLKALPGISKFVHGIKVVAANVHNNYFAPNLGKSKTFMLSSNLFSDLIVRYNSKS